MVVLHSCECNTTEKIGTSKVPDLIVPELAVGAEGSELFKGFC
jgi:hypothetical protein